VTQDLVSSVPGIYTALVGLVKGAAEEQPEVVSVFDFALGQLVPARYITVEGIEGPRYEWEAIPLQMREVYDIHGKVTVFSGDSPATNPRLALQVLTETFGLFQSCVMTPALEKRGAPTFGTDGPSAQIVLPLEASYDAAPGSMDGGPSGWSGVITWSFHFEAVITPA
jgi:hypothetical protein